MKKQDARYFAGKMEDFLNIPSFVCEKMEEELMNEKYESVCFFILRRLKEINSDTND